MNFFDWEFAWAILPRLLDASLKTIGITLAGFCIAIVLGLFLAEWRVNQVQRERSAQIARSYLLLIDPLLKANTVAHNP